MNTMRYLLILIGTLIFSNSDAQQDFNLELISKSFTGETYNDVWGYVDSTGVEYAIMGSRDSTKIWSLEDPASPILRASILGPSGTWRDIKHFEDHLYVTSDQGADGLMIIDMSGAPTNIISKFWRPTITIDDIEEPLNRCHNVYVDPETGYGFLSGCNVANKGVLILDLNQDKANPVHVGTVNAAYAHDCYARNDMLYTADIYEGGFSIYDITNKSNPVLLGHQTTSRDFCHNIWISDDGNFAFTTDERGDAWVDSYDISDPKNIKFLDKFKPLETENQGVIPHNTHYLDGFLITSWYSDGVVVIDANKPDNLIKVASYDTELVETNGFKGTWGAYPYLPSGLVLASDRSKGLFVLQPKDNDGNLGYQRASYLEGKVTDFNTGAKIPNVTISISASQDNRGRTDILGEYKTGLAKSGEFEVTFKHPQYNTVTILTTLVSGETTMLDVQMTNGLMTGKVVNKDNNEVISGAEIVFNSEEGGAPLLATSNEDGEWELYLSTTSTYQVNVGKWGFLNKTTSFQYETSQNLQIELEEGYQDDFFADLGWSSDGTAPEGQWEIGDAALVQGFGSVIQTDEDISTDIGSNYYVTGASSTNAESNDVDNGTAVLTSPTMELSSYNRLELSYYVWFYNFTFASATPDTMNVYITNGTDSHLIQSITESSSMWSGKYEFTLTQDQISFSDDMRIVFSLESTDGNNVLEAGIDAFKLEGFLNTSIINSDLAADEIQVFPNPSTYYITIKLDDSWPTKNEAVITDTNGRILLNTQIDSNEASFPIANFPNGVYYIQVKNESKSSSIRFIKI